MSIFPPCSLPAPQPTPEPEAPKPEASAGMRTASGASPADWAVSLPPSPRPRPGQQRPDADPLARLVRDRAGPHRRPGDLLVQRRGHRCLVRLGRVPVPQLGAVVPARHGAVPIPLALVERG